MRGIAAIRSRPAALAYLLAAFILLGGYGFYALTGHYLLRALHEGAPAWLGFLFHAGSAVPVANYFPVADAWASSILRYGAVFLLLIPVFYLGAQVRTLLRGGLFLCGLAAVSFVVRWPNLDRPLHWKEWVMAHSMIALENWESQGAVRHAFCLLQTYPEAANRHVRNLGIYLFDEEGKGYYTSFPPLSSIAPYLAIKAFGGDVSVSHVQWFNMLLHVVSSGCLFVLIWRLTYSRPYRSLVALAGGGIFLLASPCLWYFANAYSWDTFWHYPWLWALLAYYFASRYSTFCVPTGWVVVLGASCFLLSYAELQGILASGGLFLASVFRVRKGPGYAWMASVIAVATLCGLVATLVQYAQISGWMPLFQVFRSQALTRSVLTPFDPWDILGHYRRAFDYLSPLLLWAIFTMWRKDTRHWDSHSGLLLLAAWIPVLTHHVLMAEWTAVHEFSVLKTLVPLLLWLSLALAGPTGDNPSVLVLPNRRVGVGCLLLAGLLAFSVARYDQLYAEVYDPTKFQRAGEAIRSEVKLDETVFVISEEPVNELVIYYAKRNMQSVTDEAAARAWLARHGRKFGRLLQLDRNFMLTDSRPLEVGP